jgi:hypothetical protein
VNLARLQNTTSICKIIISQDACGWGVGEGPNGSIIPSKTSTFGTFHSVIPKGCKMTGSSNLSFTKQYPKARTRKEDATFACVHLSNEEIHRAPSPTLLFIAQNGVTCLFLNQSLAKEVDLL